MFHPRFVIDDNILIISSQEVQAFSRQRIGSTIATLSLRSPHGNEVESLGFDQCLLNFIFEPDVLCHSHRDILPHHFPGLTDRGLQFHPKNLIKVRIRIRIHGQNRPLLFIQEVTDDHSRKGGLPCSSFS
jgi:hypothetical protein